MLRSGEVVPDWTQRHPSYPPEYDRDPTCKLCGEELEEREAECGEYCFPCLEQAEEGLA